MSTEERSTLVAGAPAATADTSEPAGSPMSPARFRVALALCLLGIAILFGLGTWQVERLHWKEGLLAEIDHRIHAPPVDLETLLARSEAGQSIEYTPVYVTGRFLNGAERYFLSTFEGQAGWNVYTPLLLANGDLIFVNRGFVPYELRDPARRRAGQPTGTVTVTGLARVPPTVKPGYFTPNNEPNKRLFFWRDLAAMAGGLALNGNARLLPFIVDAGPGRAKGGWPVGGTTIVSLPNDHLQYAITWYGIGVVLVVMTGSMVMRRYRRRA
ncbi:SURF1 family protein [Jiella sp. MQZ9-1]|uniref:SURF1-like protein n=1 Tax=Jiella flava TaxID=2816857 RepID=A0A939G0X3_9HYPH|nr:SURF1 family protein [Jiella flava]MBO0663523.1 SURF1 family protein [Jiella flava]MCD2472098.1 SURF1 family protein [Jiella flava]